MGYPYDFHPEAETELFEAIDYLDSQRAGYGARLAEAAAITLDQIVDPPPAFPPPTARFTQKKSYSAQTLSQNLFDLF